MSPYYFCEVIFTATKKTMVEQKEVVELNSALPNELMGHHVVYRDYGTFVFYEGKLEVTSSNAEKLRKEGLVK